MINNKLSAVDHHPLLVIVGPQYIANPVQARYCAKWISKISGRCRYGIRQGKEIIDPVLTKIYTDRSTVSDKELVIAMRTDLNRYNYNFKKTCNMTLRPPLITYEIENGIPICRALLCELCQYCPLVGSLADTITPQYMSDLFSLGIIESSCVESQLHRELASGVSYPVGFSAVADSEVQLESKIDSSIDAILSSSNPHHFLTITKLGMVSVVGTTGNRDTFLILPENFCDLSLLGKVVSKMLSRQLVPKIMVDMGRVTSTNFNNKCQLIRNLLSEGSISSHLVGFLINSGDNYFDHHHRLDLVSTEYEQDQTPYEFNNLKTKMDRQHHPSVHDFDSLQCADLVIRKLLKWAHLIHNSPVRAGADI